MSINMSKKVCVFGGTGFVGRQVVRDLAHAGYSVVVACRHPEKAFYLKTAGAVGQIVPVLLKALDEASLRSVVKGCDAVVNTVGILAPSGKNTFQRIHTDFPETLGRACTTEGVRRLVHISALGCTTSKSHYAKSKKTGEDRLKVAFPKATILRPSIIFGPEDSFFNRFARMSVILPFLPLIGGGKTKFQPVYVGDVAKAVTVCLNQPRTAGQIYELGGDKILTFKQLFETMFSYTHRPKPLLSMPFSLAQLLGLLTGKLPGAPLTADQVVSLKTDNVVGPNTKTLADLGISPTPMDVILPTYLPRYRAGGRFGDKKRA